MSGSSIYQDSFGRARPNLAYQAVNRRLSLTRALTTDLAAYYEERALVEEVYVKALQKLSSRLHGSGSSTVLRAVEDLGLEQRDENRQLGAWNDVRSKLEQEVTDTAKVHETWRKKVLEEVEGPLRLSLGKSDWARWQQGDAQLASTVKEYDSTLDKVQKASCRCSLSLRPDRRADDNISLARRARARRPSRPKRPPPSSSLPNPSSLASAPPSPPPSPPTSLSLKRSTSPTPPSSRRRSSAPARSLVISVASGWRLENDYSSTSSGSTSRSRCRPGRSGRA
jgi:hypothetical protein